MGAVRRWKWWWAVRRWKQHAPRNDCGSILGVALWDEGGGSRQARIGVGGSLLQSGSVVLLQKNTVSRPACRPASQPATCALHQASLPASRLLALYLNPHPQFRTAVCCFTTSVAQGQISGNLQGVCDLTVYNFRQTPFKEVRNRMRSREAKRESAHPTHGLKK